MAVTSMLSNFFLQPLGLLALSALVPLAIFYLIQQKPEEEIMPAMMFFMKNRKSGKAHRALRTLLRNLLLLFHILLIIGFAAALAHPFFEAPAQSDKTVVVFDKSASMANDLGDAKDFVYGNLGNENTLITVGKDVNVPQEKVSGTALKSHLSGVEAVDTKTDIASALELASDYEGDVVVASDLGQTVSDKDTVEIIENMRNNDRTVNVMEIEEDNSWGIVNVDPGQDNSSVDVKNFQNSSATIEIRKKGFVKDLNIKGKSVKTVEVPMDTGRNKIELENDELDVDNTAYISVPEDKNFDVMFISERENPYFEKAIELIGFTDLETTTPPIKRDLDSDVYVIGPTTKVVTDTVNTIEEDVKSGASLVVFSHPDIADMGFDSLPIEQTGEMTEKSVEITEPRRINVGETDILEVERTSGESISRPEGAALKGEYGKGEVFFYNIQDEDFHFDFMYPVFWKNVMKDLANRPSVEELNVETGERIEGSNIQTPERGTQEGEVRTENTGFYETESATYAANLESLKESNSENTGLSEVSAGTATEKRNVQNLAAVLLAFLVLAELIYLMHLGEV